MTALLTRPQLFEVFAHELLLRAELRDVGDRLTPEEVYTPGSDINMIGAGAAAMCEEVSRAAGKAVSDLTLDGASGLALDRWVSDRYSTSIVRKTASPSRVTLQFTRPSSAAGAINYASGNVLESTTGVRFETLAIVAFGAADLGPFTVAAQAVEAGTAGNVAAGTITGFIDVPTDSSILVTNPDVAAGGDFTESDESFRARVRLFYAQARRAILAAIEFGARTVPGITQATAEEQLGTDGLPNGFVFLYVADANGQSNALLNAAVVLALGEYRGGGIWVDVFGSVPFYQSIELLLRYKTGTDSAAAFDSVRSTIIAQVNSLAPGVTLEQSLIYTSARSVSGVIVLDDAVAVPTGDIVPTSGQIIRTRADLITPSV